MSQDKPGPVLLPWEDFGRPVECKVRYSSSNRIGKFRVMYETLEDREAMRSLFALCVVLEAWEHESGRGREYIAVSELFEEVPEGGEVPQYRIEFDHPSLPLKGREPKAKFLKSLGFEWRAVRQNIVRVPLLNINTTMHKPH